MSKIINVFGSTTGNCETMAETIKTVIKDAKFEKIKDCGAKIAVEGFKADGDVDDVESELIEWAKKFV